MKEQKFIKSTYTLERNETLFSESHTESKKKGGKKPQAGIVNCY